MCRSFHVRLHRSLAKELNVNVNLKSITSQLTLACYKLILMIEMFQQVTCYKNQWGCGWENMKKKNMKKKNHFSLVPYTGGTGNFYVQCLFLDIRICFFRKLHIDFVQSNILHLILWKKMVVIIGQHSIITWINLIPMHHYFRHWLRKNIMAWAPIQYKDVVLPVYKIPLWI